LGFGPLSTTFKGFPTLGIWKAKGRPGIRLKTLVGRIGKKGGKKNLAIWFQKVGPKEDLKGYQAILNFGKKQKF